MKKNHFPLIKKSTYTPIQKTYSTYQVECTVEGYRKLLDRLGFVYKRAKLFIADNARYYRSKLIAEYSREHPCIQLHFLPPYSPNLNLIERLWKFYKKEILYNRYYETVVEFKKATHLFFDSIKNRKIELKSLLQDKFYFPHLCFS